MPLLKRNYLRFKMDQFYWDRKRQRPLKETLKVETVYLHCKIYDSEISRNIEKKFIFEVVFYDSKLTFSVSC